MVKPARQQIFEAILARFRTIRPVNGYRTNIGELGFSWKVNPWGEKEGPARAILPGFSVSDSRCTVTALTSGRQIWRMDVEVEVHAGGNDCDTYLRSAEADLIKAIGVKQWWVDGDLAARTRTNEGISSEIKITQNERVEGVMLFTFQVEFATPLWSAEPYAASS